MRCDVGSSVCSRLSPRLHGGLCDSPRAFFGSTTSISAEASHECMGREEATSGRKQREETAGCLVLVLPTGVDGPRVAASRWAATRGTRGTARICSGGQEEVGEEWTAWCLNCNQHSGSRLHEEGSHEFMGQDVVQEAESGRREQVLLDEQRLPGSRHVDEAGAWRDLGRTFNLRNLEHLSAAQREVVGYACPACRRVSSVGGLTSFPVCVQPLETPIAPREVDRDASPSADPWERPEETFALQNMGPKDDVCPCLFATPRQEPLAIAGARLDGHASPAGPRGRIDRSPVGKKVAGSSLGAAQELLQAALQTSSVLADERGPSKGSQIRPADWALSSKVRNRRAHAYNGKPSPDKDACRAFVMANQDLAFALGPLNEKLDSSFTGFTGLADDQRRREFVEGLFPRPAPQGSVDARRLDAVTRALEEVVAGLQAMAQTPSSRPSGQSQRSPLAQRSSPSGVSSPGHTVASPADPTAPQTQGGVPPSQHTASSGGATARATLGSGPPNADGLSEQGPGVVNDVEEPPMTATPSFCLAPYMPKPSRTVCETPEPACIASNQAAND
uniref:Uncharacterized protein n=1 Tax=Chromera velia CCMP2878 TaxID=1169474 RepID=A0A0G4F931_9ALVE|eukprot:Cvel_15716.t1-p1 / transcript=Cvel_15716.t1 / gene=Cvel_15716 / organism=Chromera_velia_CCMP2878 / gene_product=hypothetical protein / transcript_product=hypothetical protein / location=Cvel_scaffold1174:47553-53284(-) / protein_length=561 / sequence_SO=supercontig / SO=protein_coding / is_pseudo=false